MDKKLVVFVFPSTAVDISMDYDPNVGPVSLATAAAALPAGVVGNVATNSGMSMCVIACDAPSATPSLSYTLSGLTQNQSGHVLTANVNEAPSPVTQANDRLVGVAMLGAALGSLLR